MIIIKVKINIKLGNNFFTCFLNLIAKVHVKQKKIEAEIRKKELQKKREEENGTLFRLTQLSNNSYLDQELQEWEKEEAARKSLVQDVIDEAAEDGNPLPKSVLKLIDYFKGKLSFD